jgi:hypothetical protein
MLYLIKSAGFDPAKGSYMSLLKIGITSESNMDKRFESYRIHNPTCKILYIVPEGNEVDEKNLRFFFKKYLCRECGLEWFYYNEDIVDMFKKDINDIRNIIDKYINLDMGFKAGKKFHLPKYKLDRLLDKIELIKRKIDGSILQKDICNINKLRNYRKSLLDEILSNNKFNSEISLFKYLEDFYGENIMNKYRELVAQKTNLSSKIINIINEYEVATSFRGADSITKKLKIIYQACENLSSDDFKIFLNYIGFNEPVFLFNYFGKDKIKSFNFSYERINKEIEMLNFGKELLFNSVHSEFTIGKSYLLQDIKEKLKSIYLLIGFTKTATAIDIKDYFDVKEVRNYIRSGDEVHRNRVYKILGKKMPKINLH